MELLAAGFAEGVDVAGEGVLAGAGPPSFASRFARIYQLSAAHSDRLSEALRTLSASDMASGIGVSFGGFSSAMLSKRGV